MDVWLSYEVLCQPGESKFINLIPNHQPRVARFNANHRFGINCVMGWSITWNEYPFPPCREGKGIAWLSAKPQSCIPHHIDGRAGDSWMGSMKHPLLKAVGGAATRCTPGTDQRLSSGGLYACQVYSLKGCSHTNPNGWSPIGKHGSHMGT